MLDVFALGKQPTKMAAITSMQTISSYIVPFLNLRCGRKQLPSIKLKKTETLISTPDDMSPLIMQHLGSLGPRVQLTIGHLEVYFDIQCLRSTTQEIWFFIEGSS